jgi:hypothetical protein
MPVVDGLNWYWITLQLTLAPITALVLTLPFWRKAEMIFGNIVGSGVIFVWGIALIFREFIEVDRMVQACIEAGTTCWPRPAADIRFAVTAAISLTQVFLLFSLSLAVERRMSNREYAQEWRR